VTLPIITARLILRPYQPGDVAQIHAVYYGDEAARRLTGGASTPAQTQTTIERYIDLQQLNGYSFWAVLERETGDIVGEAGLKPFEGGGLDVELGYAFGAAYWGRGYATEAGRAIVCEAFGPLDLKRLVAVTSDDNQPSQHVLQKLGFHPDGRRKVYGGDLLHFVRERDHESQG
jgi:ribosomal-protein-alanine N-acetyltransferase